MKLKAIVTLVSLLVVGCSHRPTAPEVKTEKHFFHVLQDPIKVKMCGLSDVVSSDCMAVSLKSQFINETQELSLTLMLVNFYPPGVLVAKKKNMFGVEISSDEGRTIYMSFPEITSSGVFSDPNLYRYLDAAKIDNNGSTVIEDQFAVMFEKTSIDLSEVLSTENGKYLITLGDGSRVDLNTCRIIVSADIHGYLLPESQMFYGEYEFEDKLLSNQELEPTVKTPVE